MEREPMNRMRADYRRAFTLLEMTLVIGILAVIAAMAVPALMREIQRARLPESAKRLRSLVAMVRAHAAYDCKRYRIRFPDEENEEKDHLGGDRQPIIECEEDPFEDPEVFIRVTAPWAIGTTLLEEVWCAEVRLGRPTAAGIRESREGRSKIEDELEELFEEFEPERPPLEIEPDGTSEWATFVLTKAPRDLDLLELQDEERIEVIFEGSTGLAWLQRPLYDEELDMFEEHNWPVVLRNDFLDPEMLEEEDVLELGPFPNELLEALEAESLETLESEPS